MGQWLGQVMPMPFESDSFYARATWQLVFCFWPRHCFQSGQRLWFSWAYQGKVIRNAPGGAFYEYRYHDRQEHLIWLLKRE